MEWGKHSSLTLTLVSNLWGHQDLGRSELCRSRSFLTLNSQTVHPLPLWWGPFFEKFILSGWKRNWGISLPFSILACYDSVLFVGGALCHLPSLQSPLLPTDLQPHPVGYQWDVLLPRAAALLCCREDAWDASLSKAPWCWLIPG